MFGHKPPAQPDPATVTGPAADRWDTLALCALAVGAYLISGAATYLRGRHAELVSALRQLAPTPAEAGDVAPQDPPDAPEPAAW